LRRNKGEGPRCKISDLRGVGDFSPGGCLAREDDGWGQGVDVADDVAKREGAGGSCSTKCLPRAFWQRWSPRRATRTQALGGVPGGEVWRGRRAWAARTRKRRRRFREVVVAPPARRICGQKRRHQRRGTNQEAREEKRRCRGCAATCWCSTWVRKGQLTTGIAGIEEIRRQVGVGIGNVGDDWRAPPLIPCTR
jgi:hypothetical protein